MSDETKTGKRIVVNGRDAWLIDGIVLPRICGGAEDDDKDKKIEFTPEQQAHIDKIFNAKFADVHTKAEAKARLEVDALKAEIEALKVKPVGKKEEKKDEKKEPGTDLTALKERLAAMELREKESKERNSQAKLLTVAAELNAVNGEQVAILIQPFIKTKEDGTLYVVNAEGQERMNGDGKPMTIKEFVAEFLAANTHLVKATGHPGAGSFSNKNGSVDHSALLALSPVERIKAARAAGIK